MSADEESEAVEDGVAEDAGEAEGMSERTAKLLLLTVLLLAMWGIIAAAPWVAYVVVGILLDRGWLKVRDWQAQRGSDQSGEDEGESEEAVAETVLETLHRLADPHVFLAEFAEARGTSKEAARDALEFFGMTVRRAVRNGNRTGVGVHKDDLPPLPRPAQETPVGGVDQGQPTNQQGLSSQPIGLGGVVVKDGGEASRSHRLR